MKFSPIITRALAAVALLGTASTATAAICDEFPGPSTTRANFPIAGKSSSGSLNCGNVAALSGASFLSGQKKVQIRVTSFIPPAQPLGKVFGFENDTVPFADCEASDDEDTGGNSDNCGLFVTRWRSELDVSF